MAVILRLLVLVAEQMRGIGRGHGELISAASDSPRRFCSQQFTFHDWLYLLNRPRGPSLAKQPAIHVLWLEMGFWTGETRRAPERFGVTDQVRG